MKKEWPRLWDKQKKIKGNLYWVLDCRKMVRGQRTGEMMYFQDKFSALAEQKMKRTQLWNSGMAAAQVVSVDFISDISKSEILLKAHNTSILQVVDDWIKTKSLTQSVTVNEAIEEWLAFKKAMVERKDITQVHLTCLKSCIAYFTRSFDGKTLHLILKRDVLKWLDTLPGSSTNRHNIRKAACNFLNWAVKRDYVATNYLFNHGIKKKRIKHVEILSIDECRSLLMSARESQLYGYVLLSLFAGLRPAEGQRIKSWDQFQNGQLHIIRSKTRSRWITLDPRLWTALIKLKTNRKPLIPIGYRNRFDEVKANAGWVATENVQQHVGLVKCEKWKDNTKNWVQDGMRHSYASYTLPIKTNIYDLAHHMGNSPETIKKDYERAIPIDQAHQFWKLLDEELVFIDQKKT